jgi:hypothetical protein
MIVENEKIEILYVVVVRSGFKLAMIADFESRAFYKKCHVIFDR